MRRFSTLVAKAKLQAAAAARSSQGFVGVATVGAGAYIQFGIGVALLAIGGFLLLAQWSGA